MDDDPEVAVGNRVDTTSTGSVIQAGSVHGDINLHRGVALEYRAPRQLPATSKHFVGRAGELARLTGLASAPHGRGSRICVIEGPPGVGKTSLATRWAHDLADRFFPDGQIYLDLHGFTPGRSALDRERAVLALLSALRVAPDAVPHDADSRTALFRDLTHDRALLLILDNARDSGQVEPLLPGSRTCFVLVTSRRRPAALQALYGAEVLRLTPLARAESLELFESYLGAELAESPAVELLAEKCADLPLAVSITAASALHHSGMDLDRFAEDVRDGDLHLGSPAFDVPAVDLRAVVASSYDLLSAGAARALRLTSLYPGDSFDTRAAAALSGLSVPETDAHLHELSSHNLLLVESGRYRFHDLLRIFARERCDDLDPETDRRTALAGFLDYALHAAFRADRYLNPHRSPITVPAPPEGVALPVVGGYAAAAAWFTAEITALLAAARVAFDQGALVHAWMIPWTTVNFLHLQGRWQDLVDCLTVALAAVGSLGDVIAENRVLQSLARAYDEMGQPERAAEHYSLALVNHSRSGDTNGVANCLNGRAGSHLRAGRVEDALADARAALDTYTDRDDLVGQASTTNLLGRVHTASGSPHRAVALHGRAHRIFKRVGDRYGQAQTLDALGLTLSALGRHRAAAVCHGRAIALHEELGNTAHLVRSRSWITRALDRAGSGAWTPGPPAAAPRGDGGREGAR